MSDFLREQDDVRIGSHGAVGFVDVAESDVGVGEKFLVDDHPDQLLADFVGLVGFVGQGVGSGEGWFYMCIPKRPDQLGERFPFIGFNSFVSLPEYVADERGDVDGELGRTFGEVFLKPGAVLVVDDFVEAPDPDRSELANLLSG